MGVTSRSKKVSTRPSFQTSFDKEDVRSNLNELAAMMENEATFGLGKYPGTSEVVLKNIINDTTYESILLMSNKKPVAFTSLRLPESDGDLAHLNDFMVAPELQGQGLGKKLVKSVLERIAALGLKGVYFEENAALDFWERIPQVSLLHDDSAGFNIWVLAPEPLDNTLLVDRQTMRIVAAND